MRYWIVIGILFLLLVAGCQKEGETTSKNTQVEQPADVSLLTEDNMEIKGRYYPNPTSDKGLVLIHQMNKDKSSYDPWITAFQKSHNVLAIDLRGHGQSSGDVEQFGSQDFINMELDVDAAKTFLERKGILPGKVSYIGASIGANTVQNYIVDHEFDKAVLLSPGANYSGIIIQLKDTGALSIVNSDETYSYDTVKQLEWVGKNSKFIYLENAGHGTAMLNDELVGRIIEHLNS